MMTDVRYLRYLLLGNQWMDKELEDRIDEQFPKSNYRRKSVLCPITGKETQHRYGLHDDVYKLIEDGLKWREMIANSGRKPRTYYSSYGSIYHRADVMDFVRNLLNLPWRKVSWTAYYESDQREDRLEPEGRREKSDSLPVIDLTDREAQLVVEFVEALKGFIERTKRDEFDRGHKLMLGLANGTVTIDEVNKANGVK